MKTTTVSRGYKCGVKIQDECVIQTEEEWKALFQQAYPERNFEDHGAGYDFSAQTLIAVFQGESHERSAIKIEGVKEKGDVLEVLVSHNNGQASKDTWSPYHIVRVPKTEKPVEFNYQGKSDLTVSDYKKA